MDALKHVPQTAEEMASSHRATQVRKVVLRPLQQLFAEFIPNHMMVLPSQRFGNVRASRLLIVGHKDDCLHGLAFYLLDILGFRQPNAHDGAFSNLACQMDLSTMPLDNVLADRHP
jgi:hypothetical protein